MLMGGERERSSSQQAVKKLWNRGSDREIDFDFHIYFGIGSWTRNFLQHQHDCLILNEIRVLRFIRLFFFLLSLFVLSCEFLKLGRTICKTRLCVLWDGIFSFLPKKSRLSPPTHMESKKHQPKRYNIFDQKLSMSWNIHIKRNWKQRKFIAKEIQICSFSRKLKQNDKEETI